MNYYREKPVGESPADAPCTRPDPLADHYVSISDTSYRAQNSGAGSAGTRHRRRELSAAANTFLGQR